VYTESRAVMVLNPNVPKNALSGVAEVCRDLWRAECVTKGACSVRGGAMGNRWLRDPTAPVVYSTVKKSETGGDAAFSGGEGERC
jgi:hypothetical protein